MQEVSVKKSFEKLARMGYFARGVIYLVIGGLALLAALGEGGKTTDSKGALLEIYQQPFGKTMLSVLVIGLVGYVIWRLVQSIKDTDDHGLSAKGIAIRVGLFISAITHGLLAYWAISILLGDGSQSGSSGNGFKFLSATATQIVLFLAALGCAVAGVAHIYKGWTARFERYMNVPADKESYVNPICRFGLIARGGVWCIISFFIFQSAWRASTGDITGVQEALEAIRTSSSGTILLSVAAAGLCAFGIYSFLESIYRKVDAN